LEAEQIERLLDNCDDPQVPYLRPIVMMTLHTGMRLGEILGLRWDDMDLKRRLITVTKTKNHARKTIPINDVLYEELNRLPRHVASPHLFCHSDSPRFLRIDRSFHHALKRANIDEFRFHDLRHTFGSHLTMRGLSPETIGALLGHRDLKMTNAMPICHPPHLRKPLPPSRIFNREQNGNMPQTQPRRRTENSRQRSTPGET
jgi:integrase